MQGLDREEMAVRTLWLMPLLLFAAPCVAGPTQQERIEHFWLFAHCRPIRLVVEIALGSPAFADLETPIRDAVESRMRAARLLTTQNAPLPALYVEVEGYKDLAFNVKLTFKKWLYDPIVNDTWLAATWMSAGIGMADRTNPETIFTAVGYHIDDFITQYLRVNQSACVNR